MRFIQVLALLLAGCSTAPELTLLVGPRHSEGETEKFALTATLIQRVGKRAVVGCAHNSVVNKGEPFNNQREVTFDHCGAGVRWGGKSR